MNDLAEALKARLDAAEAALIAYREHRERGDHVNVEGQDPADCDEHDSCARCIATSQANPYGDVAFGFADIEAKRKMIDDVAPKVEGLWRPVDGEWGCDYDDPNGRDILVILAAPYIAHAQPHLDGEGNCLCACAVCVGDWEPMRLGGERRGCRCSECVHDCPDWRLDRELFDQVSGVA